MSLPEPGRAAVSICGYAARLNRVVRLALVLAASAAAFGAPAAARAAGKAAVPTTWCGGASPAQADRKPDLLAGNQINVIYAHPSDTADGFGALASPIASDIASIDLWWRKQDPTRTPRFDLFGFPGCSSTFGKLDLADVTLPQPASYYYGLDTRFNRILDDLDRAPFNVNSPSRKYIIYYDADVEQTLVCGQGGGLANRYSNGPSWAIVYVRSCGVTIGDGNAGAHVAAHELIHSLGAVAPGAPNECAPPHDGHVCDNPADILYWIFSTGDIFDGAILDFNHDDYYGNGGPNDIRNSTWLIHTDATQFTLTVTTAGRGSGRVTSDISGIDCPGTCSLTEPQGTPVTLTATPETGSRFVGWGGACRGLDECDVTFDAAESVTATFGPEQHRLRVTLKGRGKVVSTPGAIACPSKCTGAFDAGSAVTLRAIPAAGYAFAGWSGACRGKGACSVTMAADATVRATFKKR